MRRVVITGVGCVSPCGLTTEESWDAIVSGKSGIARIAGFDATGFRSQIAGECRGFDAEKWVERKKIKEGGRFIHLAIAASAQAIQSAAFAPSDKEKESVGTFIGVGMCALELMEKNIATLLERGPNKISPYFIPATISNLAPGSISMKWGFRGPSYTTTSACSSGAHAIGEAFNWIRMGRIDAAIAGGAEAAVTGIGVGGFTAMHALSTRNEEPEKASRPFDKGRDGFVIAEGAGVLILEERERAIKRGAPILAELLGYGATADAHHLTQPAPEGAGAQAAMRMALTDGRIDTERVDYVNAHGTSTPYGDAAEVQAMKAVFGEHALSKKLWVSSTKSMTGHLLGAAGGLEAALSVLAIARSVVPPTINLDEVSDDCAGLDFVPHQARERKLSVVLSNSFGFGGTNVTLAFGRHG